MSTLKVNTINAATSGQAVAVDISNPRSFRNLIINGAMQVAQRGTSSTAVGYQTVDRFRINFSGHDEALTQAQHALTSSDTGPWEKGFRNSVHVTNGNQTGGTDGGDYAQIQYTVEAQDLANSGWDYTSASSNITISFWAKSSVAKTFILSLYAGDGTARQYNHKYTLAANTWTKVTKTIPGSSSPAIQIDNNNGAGLVIEIFQYVGTNFTSGSTVDQWVTYVGNSSTPDDTSTWWTTNDATFEITGVQLEVGSYATDFEHRSYGDELARCQRYFFSIFGDDTDYAGIMGYAHSSSDMRYSVRFPVPMRANPSYTGSATSFVLDAADDSTEINLSANEIWMSIKTPNPSSCSLKKSPGGMTAGQGGQMQFTEDGGWLFFSAEL